MNKLLILAIIPFLLGATLQDYPHTFIEDERAVVSIIVGDNAAASDTIGAVEIATSVQHNPATGKSYPGVQARLASEVEAIESENLIVVGGPCANPIAAYLHNFPQPCYSSIEANTGIIELHEFGETSVLLVAGSSAIDTRRAARVLAEFPNRDFGTKTLVEVTQPTQRDTLVR